jgi:hypothetical protein
MGIAGSLWRVIRVVVGCALVVAGVVRDEIAWQRTRDAAWEPGPLAWFRTITCEMADFLRR